VLGDPADLEVILLKYKEGTEHLPRILHLCLWNGTAESQKQSGVMVDSGANPRPQEDLP